MLVRRYGTSYACRLIIFNYHPFTPDPPFTLDFTQFIRPNKPLSTTKRHGLTAYSMWHDAPVSCGLQNRRNLRKHASWTCFPHACLDMHRTVYRQWSDTWSQDDDPCGLPDGQIVIAHQTECNYRIGLKGRLHSSPCHRGKTQNDIAF